MVVVSTVGATTESLVVGVSTIGATTESLVVGASTVGATTESLGGSTVAGLPFPSISLPPALKIGFTCEKKSIFSFTLFSGFSFGPHEKGFN